jgi:hypothetical protein
MNTPILDWLEQMAVGVRVNGRQLVEVEIWIILACAALVPLLYG